MADKLFRCPLCKQQRPQSAKYQAFCVECERKLCKTPLPAEALEFKQAGGRVAQDQASGELQIEIDTRQNSSESRDRLLTALGKLNRVGQLKVRVAGEDLDGVLASIADAAALRQLDVSYNQLTDRGLERLRSFTRLTTLFLGATQITTSSLARLAELRTLKALDLSQTNFDDAAVTMLGRLPQLRSLSLAHTLISDLSVPSLAQLRNLSQVVLQGSLVTAAGVAALRSSKPGLQVQWTPSLQLIGYWVPHRPEEEEHEEVESWCIHPRGLVDPAWELEERTRIVEYLSTAPVAWAFAGLSPCRFGCGHNGSAEQSDGVWVWPSGLAHYVERHNVRLPDDLVSHMRSRGFCPPTVLEPTSTKGVPSSAYWRSWCRLQTGRLKLDDSQ